MNAVRWLDRYLLGEPVSKLEVVAAVLEDRSPAIAAAPFYRALESVGARAADESFIALRLILAERAADDAGVRRLRALAGLARAAATGDVKGWTALMRRDAEVVRDLAGASFEAERLGRAARAAYFSELDH